VTARRRRGLLLLSVALASGGLAASQVHDRERRAAEQIGPPVDVLVAARDLRAGARIVRGAMAVRAVPARFVPPDALASAAGVVGARVAVPVAQGGYLTAGLFEGSGKPAGENGTRKGERAVTVEVAGGSALADLMSGSGIGGASSDLALGARVDVLVSTEAGAGAGRTVMALAGAELLQLGEAGGGYADPESASSASTGPTALATLRVSLGQAIYLTAADNFAREIRLLPRPPGDRSRAGGAVSQGQL
jgi:pilus assembly protein CpaB